MRELYAGCRALVMPGEEDFGITPVEALASGKAVIALGRGGALESLPEEGGVFYGTPTEEELGRAMDRFEELENGIDPGSLQAAARFSEGEFARKMRGFLELG